MSSAVGTRFIASRVGKGGAHVRIERIIEDTPARLYFTLREHACAAMRSGRHVIVEKPMEITLPAIDEILRVQQEMGVKLARLPVLPTNAHVHEVGVFLGQILGWEHNPG